VKTAMLKGHMQLVQHSSNLLHQPAFVAPLQRAWDGQCW